MFVSTANVIIINLPFFFDFYMMNLEAYSHYTEINDAQAQNKCKNIKHILYLYTAVFLFIVFS